MLIHTGIYFDIPEGTEIQVRPRSGLAFKQGLTVINTPGTIDESYTGECCVLVINLSDKEIFISNGDRIAQLIIMPYISANFIECDALSDTERGKGGLGSTGK